MPTVEEDDEDLDTSREEKAVQPGYKDAADEENYDDDDDDEEEEQEGAAGGGEDDADDEELVRILLYSSLSNYITTYIVEL
jgi:hypothetical protein